jgi:hypothetical protein
VIAPIVLYGWSRARSPSCAVVIGLPYAAASLTDQPTYPFLPELINFLRTLCVHIHTVAGRVRHRSEGMAQSFLPLHFSPTVYKHHLPAASITALSAFTVPLLPNTVVRRAACLARIAEGKVGRNQIRG